MSMYADDAIIYTTFMLPVVVAWKVEAHVRRFYKYFLKWGLTINTEESELI